MYSVRILCGVSLLVLALVVSGCSTSPVHIGYSPSVSPEHDSNPGPEAVAVGEFSDDRGEPTHWIGAIRGGFGNPVKTLETERTVSTMVEGVVEQALIEHGLYASDGSYLVTGSIRRLDGDQVARREATVTLEMELLDRDTQDELLQRTVEASDINGSALTLKSGIFGSVEELRALIERVLSEAVNEFIGSPAFAAAIRPDPIGESRTERGQVHLSVARSEPDPLFQSRTE